MRQIQRGGENGIPSARPDTRFDTRGMVLAALFAALLAVFSQLAVPMVPVPINLGLLAVYLCALALEPRWALISVGLFLSMGAVGLPVFAGFRGGPAALFGPTGGYLLGYVCAAGLIAAFKERADSLFGRVLLLVLGMLSCYIPGTLWLMMLTGRTAAEALPLAVYPFLPGDAVKIIAAAMLAPKLRKALRRAA